MNDELYERFTTLLVNMTSELVSSRARVKALEELLTERGQITREEYETRYDEVYERNEKLYKEELLEGVNINE